MQGVLTIGGAGGKLKAMKKIRDFFAWRRFVAKFDKGLYKGAIRPFDDEFLSRFKGMYFGGLPIYYYLNDFYAQGKCYDASAVLALAFGDCIVCRGYLNSQKYNWNGYTEHGWIEKDGYVYDTTWRVFCPTDVYYNVFKPTCVDKRDSKRFFEYCKEVSDWTIRDKQWYENNYSPAASLAVLTARAIAKIYANSTKIDENERKLWSDLLVDLPNAVMAPHIELE